MSTWTHHYMMNYCIASLGNLCLLFFYWLDELYFALDDFICVVFCTISIAIYHHLRHGVVSMSAHKVCVYAWTKGRLPYALRHCGHGKLYIIKVYVPPSASVTK